MTYARNRHRFPLLLATLLCALVCSAEARVLRVDDDAPPGGDGTSWATAFDDLQDALGVAAFGGEIWVAAGVYRPTARTDPGDPRSATFQLVGGLRIYGGFAGIESTVDLRDPARNETILSGDLAGDDVAVADPIDMLNEPTRAENAYHVVMADFIGSPTVLDGLIVTGGSANGDATYASSQGGGVWHRLDRLTFVNCTFRANTARDRGGALAGGPILTRCLLAHNAAGDLGGAFSGGGTLTDCVLRGNKSRNGGGAAHFLAASIINCVFVGNQADGDKGGGGVYTTGNPIFLNCTFAGNRTSGRSSGAGLNSAVLIGRPRIVNSIFWGNRTRDNVLPWEQIGGAADIEFSCVEDGRAGTEVIRLDPAFARNPDDGGDGWGVGDNDDFGDLRLRCGSPCLDAGTNTPAGGLPEFDLEGRPRIAGTAVDMGAYEGRLQAFVITGEPVLVPEGGTATFTVALACEPRVALSASVVPWAGDRDLLVQDGGLLVFDPSNFDTPQTVTLFAAEDDDQLFGAATFRLTSDGVVPATVRAYELDNDRPSVLFVDSTARGAETGASWNNAFVDLQDALVLADALAPAVTEIWVAAGTYRPSERTHPDDPRSATFRVGRGVAVYGGFVGAETARGQRDPARNETVLSGDLDDNDAPFAGADRLRYEPTRAENAYHVLTAETLDPGSRLDGFVIARGHATGYGGMRSDGGGILLREAQLAVIGCTFRHNVAGQGGAIRDLWSRLTVERCTFLENSGSGSGLYTDRSESLVLSSAFMGNHRDAIRVQGPGVASIVGCVVVGNPIEIGYEARVTVLNSTFTGSGRRAIVINSRGTATIKNSVIWPSVRGAMPADVPAIQAFGTGTVTVEYSCVQGGWPDGVGNIDRHPGFVLAPDDGGDGWGVGDNDAPGDARLRCGSPCLDAGDTDAVPPQLVTDLDGRPRIVGGVVDLGAFEGPNQAIILSATEPDVPEAETAARLTVSENGVLSLSMTLACDPGEPIEVETVRVSGDPDIDVASGRILRFDATNFATPQAITLAAADDLDPFAGVATFRASMPDVTSVFLTVTEHDDDVRSILFVDADARGADNGTSWADAFVDLQIALLVARQFPEIVDEIWVAAGTYRPARPGGDRDASFELDIGIGIYGGFVGTEVERDPRDWTANVTVLSGDLNADDQGSGENTNENSSHVVTIPCRPGAAIRLDGFTITGGNADGEFPPSQGAGILFHGAATVRNCIVTGNSSAGDGDGVAIRHINLNCNGRATPPLFKGCTFDGDRLYLIEGTVRLEACTLVNSGADLHLSRLEASSVSFLKSSIHLKESQLTMERCSMWGSVGVNDHSRATLINCAVLGGVGLNRDSSLRAVNCTIGRLAFGGSQLQSTTTVRNCILWPVADEGLTITGIENGFGNRADIEHSLIKGGWIGKGNLDTDPMFVRSPSDDDPGDLRLRPGSPAIDAGDNSPLPTDATDLAGIPRFLDDPATPDSGVGTPPIVDIGAYEFAMDGDFDFDFDLDLADFLALLACQHGRPVSVEDDCRRADMDHDGDVDLADLITFQARFTGSR